VAVLRLNPVDYFTLALDYEIRRSGLAGNYCAIAFEVEGIPDHKEIAQRCREFAEQFPVAVSRLTQHGRQYFWIPSDDNSLPFHITRLDPTEVGDHNLWCYLVDILNDGTPASLSAPFELHLIEIADCSLLVLRWFHPMADAKGAELVLRHLFHTSTDLERPSQTPVDFLLRQWSLWRKIRLAKQAALSIRELDMYTSILPSESKPTSCRLALKMVSYDEEQTDQILTHARKHTGMTGTALYFIGCMMRAMEAAGTTKTGEAYCVPYAVNLRKRRAVFPMFGNQVSFLFAQIKRDIVKSRDKLFDQLRDQNMAAIRRKLDQAMLPMMQAGTWLSLRKFGDIVRNSPRGRERSSFWFSFTGEMEPEPSNIAGCPIIGMYQASHISMPPGLGLLASIFQGRLTLSYNYIEGQFQVDWLEQLAQGMTAELLGRP